MGQWAMGSGPNTRIVCMYMLPSTGISNGPSVRLQLTAAMVIDVQSTVVSTTPYRYDIPGRKLVYIVPGIYRRYGNHKYYVQYCCL